MKVIMPSIKLFKQIFGFACTIFFCYTSYAQKLQINDSGYFEKRGVNVLVFNYEYNGMFFDEKTSGIELIHHGVRTATGGAVRLQNTPEQEDWLFFWGENEVTVGVCADYIFLAN